MKLFTRVFNETSYRFVLEIVGSMKIMLPTNSEVSMSNFKILNRNLSAKHIFSVLLPVFKNENKNFENKTIPNETLFTEL